MRNAIKKFSLVLLLLIPAMGFSQYLNYSVRVNSITSYEGGIGGNCWEGGTEEYSRFVLFADNQNLNQSIIVRRIDNSATGTIFTCDQCNNNGNCGRSGFPTHIGSRVGTNATQARIRLYAWEDDGGGRCSYNGGDDCRRDQTQIRTFALYPPNTWNTFIMGSTNDHRLDYSVLWSCSPPSIAGEFGNNQWYASVYDGRNYNLTGLAYMGRYVETSLNINSANRWSTSGTPASASGYAGCDPGVDNHTVSYKRRGFPCGQYQLSIPTHDDEVQLWIDGTKVADFTGCCTNRGVVWTGFLGPDSEVEYRWGEGGGGSQGVLNFNKIGNAPGNPAAFGSNTWTAYVYDGTNINLSGLAYSGFYPHGSDLNFDSRDRWCTTCTPADNNNYQGCDPGFNSHTVVYKRQGFPCGRYRLSIPTHDDYVRVYVNGSQVFQHLNGCCDAHSNIGTFNLDGNSTIEYRWIEGTGGSRGALSFTRLANPPTVSCPSNITVGTGSANCVGSASWNQPTYTDACEGQPISGFTYVGGFGQNHYYRYNGNVTWTDANSIAIANGGDLVAIGSSSENTFVRNNITGSSWIGFNDAANEGNFVWSNGEPNSGFTSWNPGEPNNSGNEDYAEIQTNGRWNDLSNGTNRPFVMELGVSQTCGIAPGGTFPLGTTTICYEGRNQNNETDNCTFTVTVQDNQNPSISCPSNIVVNAATGDCDANVSYNVNFSDNCPGASLNQTAGIGSGGTFPLGTTTNSFTVSDGAGNSASCSFTVTVNDNQPPAITCPSNIVAAADPGACSASVIVPSPLVTDNCSSNWSVAFDGGSEYIDAGTGTSLAMSSSMTFETWVYPTGNQNGILANREGEYEFARFPDGKLYWAFANSNPGWAWIGTGATLPLNTWTHIAVSYSSGTIRTYKNGVQVHVFNGSGNIGDVDANDHFWIGGRACCSQFLQGRVDEVRIWNVARSANQISTNYNRTLGGNEPGLRGYWPIEEGTGSGTTADVSPFNNNGTLFNMELNSDWISPGAPVFSGTLTNSFNNTADASGTYPVGTTNVTWTATDGSGNSTSCTMTVTVNDNQNPTIGCPSNITVNNDVGQCGATIIYALSANDNCGIASTSVTPSSGTFFAVGSTNVNATTTDLSGNTASCSFTVTVNDNQAPSLSCQNITANLGTGQTVTVSPAQLLGTGSNDNCGIVNTSVSPNTFTCANLGQTVSVTVTAYDAAANSSNCTAQVTIADPNSVCNQAPNAVCQNLTVNANGNCQGIATASAFDGGSTDPNGDPLTFAVSPAGPYPIGTTNITLTVSDPAGLQDQCNASITVVDNTNPVAVCQDVTVQLNAAGNGTTSASAVNNGSSDACGIASASLSQTSFNCSDVGNNTVTLTVTDNNGNVSTCTANATVQDNVNPVATCQDVTVQLDAAGNGSTSASAINNGSSDACGIASTSLSTTSFGCSDVGNNAVTLTVTDNNGNVSTCTANVDVQDNIAPVAICQDVTVQLNASGSGTITAADVDSGSNDACGIGNLTLTSTAFKCANVGGNILTLTVTDNNGNTSSCTTNVNVQDNVAPAAVCKDVTVQLNASGTGSTSTAAVDNGSGDACGISSLTLSNSNFSCADVGNNTVTLTATDVNGNQNTCTANVSVQDNVAPVAVCQDVTVQLDGAGSASTTAADINNGSSDACGIQSLSLNPSSFGCGDLGSNSVTLTVTDNNGNQSTCTANVEVEDNIAPSITCPANVTLCTDAFCQVTLPDFTGLGTTVLANSTNDFNGAQGFRNWEYAKASYSGGSLFNWAQLPNFTGFVHNNPGTTLNFPQMDANGGHPDLDNLLHAVRRWTSNYSGAATLHLEFFDRDQNCGDGAHVRVFQNNTEIWQYFNIPGNLTAFDIPVNLSCGDVLDFSIDPKFNAGCDDTHFTIEVRAANAANAADNCGVTSIPQSPSPQNGTQLGTTPVTLTASDAAGNSTSCTFNVVVQDQTNPVAICQDVTVQLDASGSGSTTASAVDNGSNDACGIQSLALSATSFTCANVGANAVTLTVTDNNGNISTCGANVEVEDNVAPVAICQDVTVQLDASGNGSTTASAVDNGSNDACGIQSLALSATNFTCANVGANAVTLTVTDNNGNVSTCGANVEVEDNVAPVAICQDVTVQLDASGNGSTTASAVDNGSNDACGIQSLALSATSFTCANVGANAVTLTVTDNNGNVSTCGANVEVEDNVAPVAICQDVTVQLDASGNGSTTASAVDNGSNDACGIQSLALSATSFNCANVGANAVTLTVTDNNGNVSTCGANVEVEDNVAPVAICQDVTVQLDASGNGSTTASAVDNGSNDACGIQSFALSATSFTCSNVGANAVTLTVTDNNGNVSTCGANVEVEDNVAPVAICQDVTVQLDASGNGSTTASAVDNGSNDACGIQSLSLSATNFTCANVGPNAVTLTVTDNNGNVSTCGANVEVEDNVAPVAICQDVTVQLDASGNGSTTASAVDNGSNDACGIQSLALSATSFTCANVGANAVTLTVTDNNGNVSTCGANVEVEDNVAPVAICQDVTVQLDASGNGSTTASAVDNGSNDACGIQSLALSATSFTCTNVGPNAVTLTVTDNNGNVSTCGANVEVEDNVAPVAICQDVTVQLDASGNGSTTASAVDNGSNDACGIQSLALSATSFTCANVGANAVTLTVTDNNGNVSTCGANVEVEDNVAPVAICQDVTVQLDASGNGSTTASAVDNGSNDACGIQSLSLSATSFTCSNVGANAVTLTVTDNNGNVSTCGANVEVEDNVAPVAICQDVTVQLDASGNGSTTASAVDNGSNDACGIQSLALSATSFTCSNVGANAVTLTVTDNNGNVSTCGANVEVEDNVAPVAICQDVTVQLDASGNGSTTASAVDNGSNDACGIQSLALSATNFTCANVGANAVTLTVTDNNGNISTCGANVEVEDNVAPVAICQDITINLDSTGTQTVLAGQIDNGSNDACGIASLSVNPNTFDCTQDGPNTVTLTVTDVNSNVSNCTAIVTVTNDPLQITSLTSPTFNCGFNVTCNGATDGSASVLVKGGCLPYTYSWSDGQTTPTASGLGAGSYTVTITDANGTTTSQAITLTEPAPLASNINKVKYQCGFNISCNGASDGRAVVFVSGGCAPYTYSWTGPGGYTTTNRIIIGVPAGTYNVNIVDANGCTTSNSVTLTEPAPLLSTVSSPTFNCGFNVTCNGANDGSVDLAVTGGCGPYAYTWNGPGGFTSNTEDLSSLVAGTYNVNIVDRNGCSTSNTITLTEPAELVVDSIIKSVYACGYSISCNGASDGTVNALVSGGCQPYSYTWTNISNNNGVGGNQNVNGLSAGTYLVTVTDDNGCQAFRQVELSEPDPLVSSISSPTFVCGFNITCNGAADGSIDIGPTGGADCLPYNYAWTGPGGFTANTEDIANLGAGTYSVLITDANGCATTQSITLTEPDPLVITNLSSPTFVCGYNLSCNGAGDGSIALDLTGGASCVAYTYAWTGPGGFTANTEDLIALDAGTYNVTVTDANGCSVSNSITLTEPDPLVISNLSSPTFVCGYNISCNGAGDGSIALDLTGGASCVAYTYAWTGPGGFTANTEDLTALDAGTYNVTVTDANGCSVSNSITLTEPDPLVISNLSSPTFVCGYNISCNGAGDGSIALDLTGGASCVAYTYAWTGPGGFTANTEDLTALDAGTYNVTVTDANGCSVSNSITLTEPDPLVITNLSSPTFVCGYNISCNGAGDGSIALDLTGGASCVAYTYAWTGPGGFTANTEDLTALDAGTYNVTVTDANGCSVSNSITLTEPDPLVITNLSSPTFVCGYNISCNGAGDGSIALDLTGGASCVAYTYAWTGPGGFTANTEDLTALDAGTYNVTVTDANGCSVSNSITLTEPDPLVISNLSSPTFNCGYNLSCNGANDGSIALDLTGGASCVAYTYNWSGPGGFSSNSEDLSNLAAGTYTVDVTDANGCFTTDTITLTQPDPLVIDSIVAVEYVGGNNIRCNGELNGTIFVYFKGGADCLQANAVASGPAATSSGNSFSPITIGNLGAGLNSITVTDANGCTATSSITLTEPDTLITDAGPNQTVYFGFPDSSCAFLEAIGTTGGVPGYSYQWVDDMGNVVAGTDTTTVCPMQTSIYYLTVTDANGCSYTDSMQVCVVDVFCSGPGNGNGNGNGGNNSSQTFIRICHIPPGNPNNAKTKCLPINAIAQHLSNGSFLGDCSQGPNPACSFTIPSSKLADGDQGSGAAGALAGQDLFEAFPNPFKDKTIIRFRLAEEDFVSLRVFNLEGKEVGVYFEEAVEAGKTYEVEFVPTDIVDGVYMAKLVSRNGVVRYRKLILVR